MKHFLILSMTILLLSGCAYKHQPIYNVNNHPVPTVAQSLSPSEIEQNIIAAGESRGWKFSRQEPGKLLASLEKDKLGAQVAISYSQTSYSIQHVSTHGMLEENGTVHSHYNFWIRNLESDIDTRLNNAPLR